MAFRRRDTFLETLYEIAVNVHECAKFFNQYKIDSPESVEEFAKKVKEYENKGDSYIHSLIRALNNTFITAIEREDILTLAGKLDDVLDGMEACASRFYMYDVCESDKYMARFGEVIEAASKEILNAMELLRERKLLPIREFTIKINDLESVGDELLRTSIRELFQTSKDPIHIIKYKELYEILESVTDSGEDVADTLETIIMRNS
ncbi:hypothetical protein BEP19_11330 [Ammoniphilus oxalaticus]|uniref:Phosphate transport regulator n=1 Tax=Ammoniphilus oxalaticus TaxID=66863 RepID=A0A419SGB5_9BACL|nr:DUF47 family protein [Ammoniphilus oxalaticus]RKD22827.1 hypothetical protein BEP19_11330 [Ammoniphilus oxalaticus]